MRNYLTEIRQSFNPTWMLDFLILEYEINTSVEGAPKGYLFINKYQ